jgi:hypothetical protein
MFASFVVFPNFAFLNLKLVNQVQWGVRERCSVQEQIGKPPEQSSIRINSQSSCAYIRNFHTGGIDSCEESIPWKNQFLLRNSLPVAVNFLKFQLCIVVYQGSKFRKKRIAGMFQHYYPEGGWGFLVLGRDSKIIHIKEKLILLHYN